MPGEASILLVDDDPAVRAQVTDWLAEAGRAVDAAETGEAGLKLLEVLTPAVILLDLELPGASGLDVLRRLSRRLLRVPVIVLTGHREPEVVVECMKLGAFDYLVKPLDATSLLTTVANAVRHHQLASALASMQRASVSLTRRPAVFFAQVERASEHDVAVLLRAGAPEERERVARAIHAGSRRSGQPFVALRCGAVPAHDQPALLAGRETGPPGRLAAAAGGTLFMDEIEALSPQAQTVLADALSAATVARIRGEGPEFRLITGSGADLAAAVRGGSLRDDLYMRIAVAELELAPLEAGAAPPPEAPLDLAEVERDAILAALDRAGGNRAEASRKLGISRATLYRRLRDLKDR